MSDVISAPELQISDHTAVMEAVMEAVLSHPMHFARYLSLGARSAPPTDREAIEAALQIQALDPEIRQMLRQIMDNSIDPDALLGRIPQHVRDALAALQEAIGGQPIAEKLRLVAEARAAVPPEEDLHQAIYRAEQILLDGAGSIYADDHSAPEFLPRTTAGDIASIDAICGALGGLVGLVAGSPTAGAAAGAGGASPGAIAGFIHVELTS